tara:strand:- start:277 stop:477 length:201 start_codon:yes stop_codon:yes gene_type:complete
MTPWILIALFIFDNKPMVMSDNILYHTEQQCKEAAQARRDILEATKPKYDFKADYWVWCSQMPQEV